MTFAEDKTYKYIYRNHSRFCRVNVLEILPLLPCLTASDQDRLRASYTQQGNQDTLWELFNRLQRRTGWVVLFIRALRTCELLDLADEVARVYQSYLPPGTPPCSLVPLEMPTVPPQVSGTSASAPGHRIPHNGYQEMQGYPMPVQDTQPPKSPGETLEQVPQAPSSGAVLRMSGGSLEPSSNLTAPNLLTSGGHREQDSELGSMHPRGAASSPTAPCGPLSPTVSFQPLARPTPRATHPPSAMSFSSSSTGLTSAKGTCDQATTAMYPRDAVAPTSSVTISSASSPTGLISVNTGSSKVPANPELLSTMPSQLSTISKTPGAVPSNVLASPAPSKSPINLTMPSSVSTSMVSTVNSVPPSRSSSKAKIQEAPTATVTIGGRLPGPDNTSRNLHSEPELSKPGILLSQEDGQPFSDCSEDLAISPSNSFSSESRGGPEEDEYVSIRVQVDESSSTDLMVGNPGLPATQQPPEDEVLTSESVSWAHWLGAASSLLAVLLAVMLYHRRLAQ